ncbi:MAG: glycosyltransferase, partial [Cyclobacteriaceae bacterium]
MIKRRIAIASVLKPIDDTRMFEKMGVTLAKTGQYDVYVIGQLSNYIPAHAGINFTGLSHVKRLSLSRLLIPVRTLSNLFKLKPEALIVNTHELLIVSLVIRILFGTRIVYDIRENYYRNIRFSEAFPSWQKFPVALWVRVKEKVTAPFFHHFILAENAYQTELNFIGRRFTILENRAIKP